MFVHLVIAMLHFVENGYMEYRFKFIFILINRKFNIEIKSFISNLNISNEYKLGPCN